MLSALNVGTTEQTASQVARRIVDRNRSAGVLRELHIQGQGGDHPGSKVPMATRKAHRRKADKRSAASRKVNR